MVSEVEAGLVGLLVGVLLSELLCLVLPGVLDQGPDVGLLLEYELVDVVVDLDELPVLESELERLVHDGGLGETVPVGERLLHGQEGLLVIDGDLVEAGLVGHGPPVLEHLGLLAVGLPHAAWRLLQSLQASKHVKITEFVQEL